MQCARGSMRMIFVATSLLLMTSQLHGQQWSVDAEAGRIHSALDPNAAETQSVALGLRYDDALTGFRISGGIPTASEHPLWGSLAGARRIVARSGRLMFGVDVAGNALALQDRVERTLEIPRRGPLSPPQLERLPSLSGYAIAGQALPLIAYERGRVEANVRAGVSHYSGHFGQQDQTRTVRLADAQLTFAPSVSLLVIPAVRHYRADEGSYTYAGISAIAGNNTLSGWATVGQWIDTEESAPWAIGATLRLHERAAVNASVRHDAIDPLYLAPAQTAWNVGVSIVLAGGRTSAAPVPARYEAGRATIRLKANGSAAPLSIAGDFNDWNPAPMQRSGDEWTFTTALKPGVYNYAFVDDRGEWFVPEKHPGRKDDGMGGHVAVLVVEP